MPIVLLALSIVLNLDVEWIIIILCMAEVIDLVWEERNRNRYNQ